MILNRDCGKGQAVRTALFISLILYYVKDNQLSLYVNRPPELPEGGYELPDAAYFVRSSISARSSAVSSTFGAPALSSNCAIFVTPAMTEGTTSWLRSQAIAS